MTIGKTPLFIASPFDFSKGAVSLRAENSIVRYGLQCECDNSVVGSRVFSGTHSSSCHPATIKRRPQDTTRKRGKQASL